MIGSELQSPLRLTGDPTILAGLPTRTITAQRDTSARYASAIQQHRGDHGGTLLTIREQDLQSLAVIYDMEPEALTAMLLHSGVLTIDGTSAQHPVNRRHRESIDRPG